MENHVTPPEGLRDIEALKQAIRAVGRTAGGDDVRANVAREAAKLGHADLVPDAWRKDGSLNGDAWTPEQRETYNDTFTALNGAVSDAMPDDEYGYCYAWVQDFTDAEVIFYYDGDLWSVGYTLEPGGAVTLAGDAVKVRPVTSYVARGREPGVEYRRARAETLDGVREVRRFLADGVELREASDGILRFTGYASVTERAYEVADFEETIARGAFKRTLSESPDVVLTVNHGEGGQLPLARTKSGTMTLSEDARGLRVDADLNPNDPDVKALVPKLERGDVDEMSFAFRVTDQTWDEDYSKRLIRGVALHKGDVSIVTYGANDASTGGLRSLRSANGELELRAGKAISTERLQRLQGVLDRLAAADEQLDAAQPELADIMGVENPDADDSRSADPERERKPVPIPVDYAKRQRERLAVLRGGLR